MVAFSSSFRVFLVSAIVLGMSANAAPSPASDGSGAWEPGSPGSHKSGDSAQSTVSAYSVATDSGECVVSSASRDRYGKDFLEEFPFLAPKNKSSNNRRGPNDGQESLADQLGFDYKERPDPTNKGTTLFHGTLPRFAGSLHGGVRIFKNRGDLSADGGFYLTNSLRAAAQWGCHGRGDEVLETVVFEYEWNPDANTKIRSHRDWESVEDYADFCSYNTCPSVPQSLKGDALKKVEALVDQKYDMIAGPMMPVGGSITAGFYQYAILNEAKAKEPFLTKTGYYLLPCKKFPPGSIDTHDAEGAVKDFEEPLRESVGMTEENSYPASKQPPAAWATGDGTISLAARPKHD